jgi:glycogen(starch) synthase
MAAGTERRVRARRTEGTSAEPRRRGRRARPSTSGARSREAGASTTSAPRRRRNARGGPKPATQGAEPPASAKKGWTRSELDALGQELSWSRPPEIAPPARPPKAARRLHILMIGWEFPPLHSGGLGVHSYELTRELTRMGHRVTFLTPFSGPFTEVPGVTFRWPGGPQLPTERPRSAGAASLEPQAEWPGSYDEAPIDPARPYHEAMTDYNGWLSKLTGLESVDVIHVHDWFGTIGAAQLARRLERPLVMTVHSTEYDRSLGHPWTEILEREQYGLDAADLVIAVSRHLKAQLVERYHVPERKIRVVYNAVRPPERLAPLGTRDPVVLYLGRLAAMKGVDTFLRAGARVLRQIPDALLVVAGEGPEFPRLLTIAAHLGIGDRTLFLGKVTEDERAGLLARASVFVLPSVVEPFGIAALEAMAAGVPTIVSKTSGVAEVAENVFAVDFWDIEEFASRIAELLEYPTLSRTMGERGQVDALKEGWTERAIETVGVYAELTGARSVAT